MQIYIKFLRMSCASGKPTLSADKTVCIGFSEKLQIEENSKTVVVYRCGGAGLNAFVSVGYVNKSM